MAFTILAEQLQPRRVHDLVMKLRTTRGAVFAVAGAGGSHVPRGGERGDADGPFDGAGQRPGGRFLLGFAHIHSVTLIHTRLTGLKSECEHGPGSTGQERTEIMRHIGMLCLGLLR